MSRATAVFFIIFVVFFCVGEVTPKAGLKLKASRLGKKIGKALKGGQKSKNGETSSASGSSSNSGSGSITGSDFDKSKYDVSKKINKKPKDLFGKNEISDALAALKATGAKNIKFQRLQGFNGIEEYQPSGWKIEVEARGKAAVREQEGEKQGAAMWPMGVGVALMNGCFGNNYKKGDPCYDIARVSPICLNIIDAANFLGVGFDGRGYYSSESRKKSVIQRTCAGKATFMGKDVPDCMNAFGIYDYSINTETFENTAKYIRYLQEKAATSEQQAMFQMESESLTNGASFGGNLEMIGSMIGLKIGGAQGAQVGATIGASIGFGTGTGSGSSSASGEGTRKSNAYAAQSRSRSAGSARHMIAILEADLKLYELVLDEVRPQDLSIHVLYDILNLPVSYFKNNADVKFQNFILRWGTHLVTSAKFGGEMRITKTSRKESSLSSDEFASQAQSEFAGMMSVLKSSFEQKETRFGFLGLGGSFTRSRQQAQGTKKERANKKASQKARGAMNNAQSEFIKTTLSVRGGNPEIAAAITEFYTPEFKDLFKAWLNSIDDYVRPFEFTLVKLSSILNMNINSLFPIDKINTGCFQKAGSLKKDSKSGLTYFETVETKVDNNKNTFTTTRRNYCKYGKSKEKFMENLLQAKLALERAETIYMAEGPFSTSNFDIVGGGHGCESQTIEYVKKDIIQTKTWPKMIRIKEAEFKVVFNMRYGLENIAKDAEYIVKFFNNRWYTKYPETKFQNEFSCQDTQKSKEICIANLPMLYDETTGFLYINQKKFKKVAWWLKGPVAKAVSLNPMGELAKSIGSIGFVPCNVKWTNSHRIHIKNAGSCIYFQAASKGSIYLITADIPEQYQTWYYLQMTSEGVSFYKGMKVMKAYKSKPSATLGEESLFTGFFVCFTKSDEKLRIDYGKAPEEKEVGVVQASFTFPDDLTFDQMYFTFGSGEDKVGISDVRVINHKPKIECGKGLTFINGQCELKCHEECNGCITPDDPGGCKSCKNQKVVVEGKIVCLHKCGSKMTKNGDTCTCPKGTRIHDGDCVDVDECALKPCKNGGTCVKDGNWYLCKCTKHYKGKHCETPIKPCYTNPCQNGGVCTNSGKEYSCKCNHLFQGKNCEKVLDECATTPCKNSGRCIRKPTGYVCECVNGYAGTKCELPSLSKDASVESALSVNDEKKLIDGNSKTCAAAKYNIKIKITFPDAISVKKVSIDFKNVNPTNAFVLIVVGGSRLRKCPLESSSSTNAVFNCKNHSDVVFLFIRLRPANRKIPFEVCDINVYNK